MRRFRGAYRATRIGARYSGGLHLALISLASLGLAGAALWGVRAPTGAELLAVLLTFLAANLVEYFAHRFPMHCRIPGLGGVYRRHAEHHHFYAKEAMSSRSWRDAEAVLCPPGMALGVAVGLVLPLCVAVRAFASANAAGLVAATLAGYFLVHEGFHAACHAPEGSWLGRRALARVLRRHHAEHHDRARMGELHFNLTLPLGDRLFGTAPRSPRGRA